MAYLDSSNVEDLVADIKALADDEYAAGSEILVGYAYCNTAGNVAAKTATVTRGRFTLDAGQVVMVWFSNDNTASNPTLNINDTGDFPIYNYSTVAVLPSSSKDGINKSRFYALSFRGNAWYVVNHAVIEDMDQSSAGAGTSTAPMAISPTVLKYAVETHMGTGSTGYCKLADGTFIQWGKISGASVNLTAAGSLFYQSYTLTFPQEFYDANISISASFGFGTGAAFPAGVLYGGLSKTQCTL